MHPDYQQPRTGADWWEYALYPTAIGVPYWGYKGVSEGWKSITSQDPAGHEAPSSAQASASHDDAARREHRHEGGGRGKRHDGMDWTTVVYVGIGVTAAVGLAYVIISHAKKA